MNLAFAPEEEAFRLMVRAFLEANLTPEIRRAQRLTTTFFPELDISSQWRQILYRQGWAAAAWPKEYGGTGWSLAQRYIWAFECARAGAPRISPIALNLVGPVLMRFATIEQKAYYLPRILSGEDYWCQGFSEPGAGSDLAALRLQAVAADDGYRLNGAKIWTTHAHFATMMIALVRTQNTGKRQEGITCLLVDMKAKGLTVRPIHTIGGDHEVNEVFFDDVFVTSASRVGSEGDGWSIAKYLLQFERGGNITSPNLRAHLATAARLTQERATVAQFESQLSHIAVDIDALEMLELRVNSALAAGGDPGAAPSMLKLRASQLQQAVSDLIMQILGEQTLRWEPARPLNALDIQEPWTDDSLPAASRYLNARANTIFGGASEIQKNLIAKYLLDQ